jgi:probable F420-dependent oxidoreductase
MDLTSIGIWAFQLDLVPSTQGQEHVAELEELGFGALWIPEAVGREALTGAGLLLAGSRRIVIATGIASIWARDAMSMNAAHQTLSEAYPGRFLLGMGVSHEVMVSRIRGHDYTKPYSAMAEYLDAMDKGLFFAAPPTEPPRRVLAALGPKMLRLAADRAAGAHPYFVPPEHTAFARETLGADPLLAVEQAVVLETDPATARTIARQHTSTYVGLPNYTNNLKRFGLTDEDFAEPGGSDRLVDTIVAWGDLDTIKARVRAHHDAGADHVCVQVIPPVATDVPLDAWRELAPALIT